MRACRGMGAMNPSKMPGAKTIRRKDNPDDVTMYAKGGAAKLDISKAIKKPGALRSALGAKKGKPIPAGKLAKAAKAPGKLGQRARFAQMLKGFKKK
jgi:hypothetical protein